jgi:hypothetical protein
MKFASQIVLFLFVFFLSAPTIVSAIDKKANTSFFYGTSEEEQLHKEIKAEFKFDTTIDLISFSNVSSCLILSENLSKHDNIASAIFIPPPDQV